MKKIYIALVLLLTSIAIQAQTMDKKWNVGFHGGATQYNGDLGNDFYQELDPFYAFGGISFSRLLGDRFDLNLLLTKGEMGFRGDTSNLRSSLTTGTLNIRFNILNSKSLIRPYIFIGSGAMIFDEEPTVDKERIDYAAPSFGGGVNIRVGPSIMLQVQEMFLYSSNDDRDGVSENTKDMYVMHTVGLTYSFGKKKDQDMDDVADRLDKCPDTPPGVAVDANGCPLDKDKDKVADHLDKCPDVAGKTELNGCPDKDNDNIADKDDRCPDIVGSEALKGCPDEDKDNIADIDDKCPGTKTGYIVDVTGCALDNDKDGLVNEEDACPDSSGVLAMKGCPDTDGDGVANNEDHCPTVKGTIVNKGCPEMAAADIKRITQIASKIFFETNSDKLKTASLIQLDELAEILKKYEGANLTIEGHTDNVGQDEYNMTLSQKRTDSVKNYLMSKGIFESRLTASGFGETKPIADNNTKSGRAKNRRVELRTEY